MASAVFNELERYRTEHLILLIGTNPIPNYVAAKLLLKPGGKLYLVHTKQTAKIAESFAKAVKPPGNSISTALRLNLGAEPVKEQVKQYDGTEVKSVISTFVKKAKTEGGRVGLHYTGGTKVMAVHAYQAMMNERGELQEEIIFSYLDAYCSRLIIDSPNQFGSGAAIPTTPSGTVLFAVEPALAVTDVVTLHGLTLNPGFISHTAVLPAQAAALAGLHTDAEQARKWHEWCRSMRCQTGQSQDSEQQQADLVLQPVVVDAPTPELLQQLGKPFTSAFVASNGKWNLSELAQANGLKDASALSWWFNGIWLENYVLNAILELQKEETASGQRRLNGAAMTIKPKGTKARGEFEVDVGVMQGYRLFAISCTAHEDKDKCKQKLIEAAERARNLGGDHAFVGLVCATDKASTVQKSIGSSWDLDGKIRVFGRSSLLSLKEDLRQWFENTCRPEGCE